MTTRSLCCAGIFRDTWDRASDRCLRLLPCLSDPARRSTLFLKVALVMLHPIYVGIIFLFDGDLIEKTRQEPFYVLDAMRLVNENDALIGRATVTLKQPASSKNDSLVVTVDKNQLGRNILCSSASPWTKLVMDMYPPGSRVSSVDPIGMHKNNENFGREDLNFIGCTRLLCNFWQFCAGSLGSLTCSYCNVLQPPRAKHCHDCDKCVLQFDHHCVWLGTCIGQGNHCQFWWYICEETTLCLWTGILYMEYLNSNIAKAWWIDVIMIWMLTIISIFLVFLLLLLLFHSYLIMTNQTTYELVRRRRVPYLRGFPERASPFSKGVCGNLYYFCCERSSMYKVEPLPTTQELKDKLRPYKCSDVLSCGCCC